MGRPYAVHRPVENTWLVRQRDRRLLKELAAVAATVVVLGGGLLAYTWVHIEILRLGYRADELERQLERLLEVERQWRLEAAWLAQPAQLERRAREELGLVPPDLEQMVYWQELGRLPPSPIPAREAAP